MPTKGEDKVTRGEYTLAGCSGYISGKGEDNAARGEPDPVGGRVLGCARSCIEDASDGIPRVNVCTYRRSGPGEGTVWGSSGDTNSNG
jgi:hypothetical protein